ncbi:S-adenosyl-L-methionine-dependent methyltransferase [Xylona heveae TC161]|uniref:S-adenosyl-L-methionine-dependent methyltransferase n=1 Tax=Xylona heveae (strain CBS 132557 / TC161) TaxID=1328760 RepID=A0A161TB58_XYLHT|nr:S-adenosyl-L-methionine-dependent methyltransferase [Xylona heveae TC161]KZF23921.1 S-adenosyl-L-methionine-dependent methyltransferase [Xylona heveae TC161]
MSEQKVKDTYGGPRHKVEYDRLRAQHELVKAEMGGKLLLCPADLSRPDLRVLDSATAEGTWLVDLATTVPSSATLIGTDISAQHFLPPADRPANVELSLHSIFDTWPAHLQEYFDVAHQRFVLSVCPNDDAGVDAVKKLFACVKPGGWIELHEGDMQSIREGPEHAAFTRFRDVMVRAWGAIGNRPRPAEHLVEWLQKAGAVDVQEHVQTIKVGAASEDREQGQRAVDMLLFLSDAMKKMLADKPGHPSAEEFDQLKVDLEKEMNTVGNVYHYRLAFGRKVSQK